MKKAVSTNNGLTDDENSLLAFSASGNIHEAARLLDKGVDVNVRGEYGLTPLVKAMEWLPHLEGKDFLGITKLLVERGADVNARDTDGTTAIYLAAAGGLFDVVLYLHGHGAALDIALDNGYTALHEIGNKMGHGLINVKLASKKNGKYAVTEDRDEIRDAIGSHPDDEFLGYVNTAKFLIENGVNVDRLTKKEKQSAILNAADNGSEELVRLILERGVADINQRDVFGLTALHFACRKGEAGIVKRLLSAGADPNVQENYGFTPLHEAAENNRPAIVKLLLDNNADPSIGLIKQFDKYAQGDTPADIAKKQGHKKLAAIIAQRSFGGENKKRGK